ncbi:MAG: DHA2 family efflux MFS transporter permease subunit [Chloroflexota bacterium]
MTNPDSKWFVFASIAAGTFLATLDGSIVNIALPTLERELHTQFAVVQWVVLGYLLTIVTLMLSIGRLADMIGKKWLYLAGVIVFTLGSMLCGTAPRVEILIAFRALQAVGAAMMVALGAAILTEVFPATERGMVLGLSSLMVSLGSISGPTVGGLILGITTWHWIFYVNVPVGVVGMLLVARFVPVTRPPGGQKFDFAGAVTLGGSLLTLLLGLSISQKNGFADPVVLSLLIAFIVLIVEFVFIETRVAQPIIDLQLFRNALFSVNLVTGYMVFVASAGTVLLMPFFLQNVLQLEPKTAGLMLTTVPLAMGASAPIAGTLSDRFGTRPLTVIGLAILVGGYTLVSTLNEHAQILTYVLCFLPIGVGMGIFNSPNNSAIMGAAPRHRLGVASGLLSLTRNIGQTTGMAIIGTLWASGVAAHGGPIGDATTAPPAIQVAALQDTLHVIVVFIALALSLSVWALWQERAGRTAHVRVVERSE